MTTPADQVVNANRDVIALTRCYHHNRHQIAVELLAALTDQETVQALAAACNLLDQAVTRLAELTNITPDSYYTILSRALDTAARPSADGQ